MPASPQVARAEASPECRLGPGWRSRTSHHAAPGTGVLPASLCSLPAAPVGLCASLHNAERSGYPQGCGLHRRCASATASVSCGTAPAGLLERPAAPTRSSQFWPAAKGQPAAEPLKHDGRTQQQWSAQIPPRARPASPAARSNPMPCPQALAQRARGAAAWRAGAASQAGRERTHVSPPAPHAAP